MYRCIVHALAKEESKIVKTDSIEQIRLFLCIPTKNKGANR